MGRIVVGIDGSRDSETALLWAASEARLRGDTLVILHAVHTPVTPVPFSGAVMLPPTPELKAYADDLLQAAAALVRNDRPGVQVVTDLVVQPPITALLSVAEHARLLVLGSRGLGTVSAAFLGSVSTRVAARAACPTVVVRSGHGEHRTSGPIVVGIDGQQSERAFRFALEEAARRGTTVEAVHAYQLPIVSLPIEAVNVAATDDHTRQAAQHHVDDLLHRHQDLTSNNGKVSTHVLADDPAAALARMSRDAALIVVGSRGRGAFTGMLLGSVSQRVLHRADCPVVVVHDGGSDAENDQP